MSIRDYDKDRMLRIAAAMNEAMFKECVVDRVCFIPVAEVFEAMALIAGTLLSTGPAARSQTRLREITTDFGRDVARRARQAQESGAASMFNVVLGEEVSH